MEPIWVVRVVEFVSSAPVLPLITKVFVVVVSVGMVMLIPEDARKNEAIIPGIIQTVLITLSVLVGLADSLEVMTDITRISPDE